MSISSRHFKIEVEVLVDINESVQSSEIVDVKNEDGSINQEALQEYLFFIEEVKELFDIMDMQVLNSEEEQNSTQSETSRYFHIHKKTPESDIFIKFLALFRISDHELPWIYQKLHKDDPKKLAEKYKRPGQQKPPKYKSFSIIVNRHTFDSYDAALVEIQNLLNQVEKKS